MKELFIQEAVSRGFFFFIYFWLRWVFVAACGLSLVAATGATLHCAAWASHCGGLSLLPYSGSRGTGFSSCGVQAQQLWLAGSRAQALLLWQEGLVATWHVGSSQTRARTRVLCIGRRILNHCATKEVPLMGF